MRCAAPRRVLSGVVVKLVPLMHDDVSYLVYFHVSLTPSPSPPPPPLFPVTRALLLICRGYESSLVWLTLSFHTKTATDTFSAKKKKK